MSLTSSMGLTIMYGTGEGNKLHCRLAYAYSVHKIQSFAEDRKLAALALAPVTLIMKFLSSAVEKSLGSYAMAE